MANRATAFWRDLLDPTVRNRWLVLRLLALVLALGGAHPAYAGTDFCSSYPLVGGFHVIDGNDPSLNTLTLPSSIGIDSNCYFKNFSRSAKWPQGLTSTLNFKSDGFVAIFENVYYSGNMACSVTTTKIWFVNNAQYSANNSCQSLFIPVETIGKQTPGPTATVGVPFTYTLTVPVMYDPATNTYYFQPSVNTLSNATIYDDLTATGASMTYVSNTAFLLNGGARTPLGSLTLGATPGTLSALGIPASDNTKHIVFSSDLNPSLGNIPAGTQVEIQMTVVLDDVPSNVAGTSFTNTAKWWFGRFIDGVAYTPLPGQSGVSAPMTIAEPNLTLTKSSSFTNLNVGTAAPFKLNVQNTGGGDAWNTTLTDVLPTGMCAFDPRTTVNARVFATDGVTPVSDVLVEGTDYTVNYSGCTLSLTTLSAAAKIGSTQRLIVNYQARLDPGTAPGLTFTNVAGATRWYSGAPSNAGRRQYNRTLTNGTPGTLDFQDTYTVTSTTQGYFFLKSVSNLTTGVPVATSAFPGDRLRYTLQIQNFTFPVLNNVTVTDELDALNATAAFVPGSLTLANSNLPAGATLTVNPTGGAKGTGSVTITGLNLASDTQYQVQFDVTLASTLANGTNVLNQGSLTGTDTQVPPKTWTGPSDDPYVNGPSLLGASVVEPTRVQIYAPGALAKATTQATAAIGEQFKYLITVPATPVNVPLYDVHILDNLGLSAANLGFVGARVTSGGGWTLVNTGTATNLDLQDTNTGIDIPAGGQAVIEVTVVLQDTSTNTKGLTFSNSASYTYNKINGDNTTRGGFSGTGSSSGAMTVVEPALGIAKAVGYVQPAGKPATDPAAPGDVLQYTVTVTNSGTAPAYDVDVTDAMPSNLALVTGSATATINGTPVSGFVATPTVLPSGALVWGAQNGDGNLDIPVGGTLVLSLRATVLTANGTPITNSVYTNWASLNGGVVGERNGAGCPNVTAPDIYCAGPAISTVTAIDPTALAKAVASDSWTTAPSTAGDATLRVGDTVVYTLTATLREGTTQNVVITDTLPAGMAFDGMVSVNGDTTAPYSQLAPFTYSDLAGPMVSGNTITWNLGAVSNAVDNVAGNNGFVIQYRARVVNTLAATPASQSLANNATLNYAIGGVAGAAKTASASVNVWQPALSVSKSAAPAAGGTVLVAGELVTYTVNITNSGSAPAYNTVLQDILPVGMRNATPFTLSVSLVNAGTALPVLAPSYSSATGTATWNFVSGVASQYAIPPGETLRVVYQAQADATLGAGMILTNQARVQHYYSLDSSDASAAARKDYGATGVAMVQLTTAAATALAKQALVTTAAIGQPFTYRITVPATPQSTALYDVRVLDNISLATTGVTLNYQGASARLASNTRTWTALNNGGTATNLVLLDSSTGGLDIPAGDQLIVDVVLVLGNDIANNSAGKQFSNTASYTYNSINNDVATQANGAPGASAAVTVAAPVLVMQKSGPATMRGGVVGTFTLNVQNTGAATAWSVVLGDVLPNVTTAPAGGMCAAAPTAVTARVYQADGVTPVSAALVNGTDFTVSYAPAPNCTLTVNLLTAATAIAPGQRLIVGYNAMLDPGTSNGIQLTNVAGATQWLSANPAAPGAAGNVHTFSNTLTNGTPGVADFQDAYTLTTEAPVLNFTKTVLNLSTGQSGASARPGDTLKYTLTIQNVSPVPASNFSLTDELDRLNATAMFVPGSLVLVSAPSGANTALTSANGGAKGSGLVSISGLSVDALGGANATAVIEFTARLAPVINHATAVLNQAQIVGPNLATQLSDDPAGAGTADPTRTQIASAPAWRVHKTVRDITSGTAVVMAGDVLRYTLTVKNIGTENATGVTLADVVPNYTSYVAGSTRLNGNLVADPAAGVSALQAGLLINAPGNTTAGAMNADAGVTTANVATVTVDVKINSTVVGGTIVSNQGFVTGSGTASGPFPTVPSDDPNTATLNDPTRVIVGALPLLNATKTVALVVDANGNGAIEAGDVVRYTITVTNQSGTAATGTTFTDTTPANTSYVANTVTLNGAGVGQPDGGVSPLVVGIGINSPGSAAGTIAAGGQAVVSFNVQVNAGVAGGTVISNQGSVASAQTPALQTDVDGNAGNGYQATTFVVGSAQQLAISKAVTVVGGGAALPGSTLEYAITVSNTGSVAATNVVITDDLTPLNGQASYVAGSGTLDGLSVGVGYSAPVLTADYAAAYGNLVPGASTTLRFRVLLASGLSTGATLSNSAQVRWNTPSLTATASVSVAVGAIPGAASLNGRVWHDVNFNRLGDAGETNLAGWSVEVLRNNILLGSVTTDTNGQYSITGLAPSASPADQYALRFSAPGATATTAKLGVADSPYVNGLHAISGITAGSGSIVQNLNLPVSPNGVAFDSIVRTPVAGARLAMVRSGSTMALPASCFDDPAQQGQVTLSGGYYRFDLNFSDPACPSGGDYLIQLTAPTTYAAGPSLVIPPMSDASTMPFSVPACPASIADAVPATGSYCEAQPSPYAPAVGVPTGTATAHYLRLTLSNSLMPGSSQIYNNHIAIDPVLANAVSITKVAALQNVTRGQLVPYTITVSNTLPVTLGSSAIVDTFPAGFKYVPGSGRLDGAPVEPVVVGNQLSWGNLQLATNTKRVIQLMLIVGGGVAEGKYVNRAQVFNALTGGAASGEASAAVRVVPDPTLDCSDIIGKVFDDLNLNGYQDEGEPGLPGVRLVTARGLIVTADRYGRFHLTCAVVPDPDRGSNFILKVDDRSLPSGYRMTTENPHVQRITRGKMSKFNFGAAIHRVVTLELSDGIFEPDSTEIRVQWRQRLELLLGELKKSASVLRLSYLADAERPGLVDDRLGAVKREITQAWKQQGGYDLSVETEIFWRTGAPR